MGRGGSFRFLRFFEENVGADRRLAGPRVTLLMTSGWAPIAGRGGYGGYGRYGVVLFFYTKVLRLGWGRPSSNTWQTRLDWHPWTNSRAVDSGQLQATICGTEGCWQVPSQRLILTLYTSDYLTSLILHTTLEVFEGSSDDHYSVKQFPSFPTPFQPFRPVHPGHQPCPAIPSTSQSVLSVSCQFATVLSCSRSKHSWMPILRAVRQMQGRARSPQGSLIKYGVWRLVSRHRWPARDRRLLHR